MALPTLYTAEEVAIKLKVSRRSVYQWLATGQLRGLRAGEGWRITEDDLLQFMSRRNQAFPDGDAGTK
jgi:excisionase family DNA binding protein